MPLSFTLARSPRRKRTVALHVESDGSVTVRAPERTSIKWIARFVESRADWIARRRAEKIRRQMRPFADGDALSIGGTTLSLRLTRGVYEPAREENGFLFLRLSPEWDEATAQAEIVTELCLFCKKKARRVFQERLAFWSERMALKPKRLVLTAPRRQWGSCTSDNDIRLNWRLIFAAPDLLDYVIVHELAHIAHKNHGASFWRRVGSYLPDWKDRRRKLRNWEAPSWLTDA